MNHVDYDLGCKIINHPVLDEVIDARDVAYNILSNVIIILQDTGEFRAWTKQPNKYWFSVTWPLDIRKGNLDDELYNACLNVLDFGDDMNYLCEKF